VGEKLRGKAAAVERTSLYKRPADDFLGSSKMPCSDGHGITGIKTRVGATCHCVLKNELLTEFLFPTEREERSVHLRQCSYESSKKYNQIIVLKSKTKVPLAP
jgi:hypothetical protein